MITDLYTCELLLPAVRRCTILKISRPDCVRQRNSCCCSLQVFNVTPYLHFHPGGVKYIMMGVGRDATSLFNKYHAWVNIDFLMSQCLVGLVEAPSKTIAAAGAVHAAEDSQSTV